MGSCRRRMEAWVMVGAVVALLFWWTTTTWADLRPPAASMQDALQRLPNLVDIRGAPMFTALGNTLAHEAGQYVTGAFGVSGAAADATAHPMAPLFLSSPDTLGRAGAWNVGIAAQSFTLDRYNGADPFASVDLPILRDRRTDALLAVRLSCFMELHVRAFALAVTYGLRDDLDVTLSVPFSHVSLDLDLEAQLLRRAQGSAFVPVPRAPTRHGHLTPVSSFGAGDLTARVKWALPLPIKSTVGLVATFPTGNPAQLHGAGDYLLDLTVDAGLPLSTRAMLVANAAASFNLSDSEQSKIVYGVGAVSLLTPRPVPIVGIVEFLGRSQLDPGLTTEETAALSLTPNGQLLEASLLGIDFDRRIDTFDLAFGIRMPFGPVAVFAAGVYPLNDQGLRPAGVTPVVGVGGSF